MQVRVPVLSEQITVTEPSVSTAGRCRMIAWWCAMRRTPRASVMVMMAGSPSGMADAASATAIMNMSEGACPRQSTPMTKVTATNSRMAAASQRLNRAIWRRSGVVPGSACASSAPMRPSSVRVPVAATAPTAVPAATSVPE
ncbi:unintegrated signal peptide [Alicycliphilus sp. B1]|nr:unintegrated signal peptide [Alicycliphilus sp. B1]